MAANFLKRCPNCLQNLVRHLCDFTCSHDQSQFINVISLEKNKKTNSEYITGIDLHVAEEYIIGTYESCKEVCLEKVEQLKDIYKYDYLIYLI